MKRNLDTLKAEIEQYLEESGLAVFYGYSRALDSAPTVYWDCEQDSDYKRFIQAARTAGARLIVLHQNVFSSERLDDALERLEGCNLSLEDSRELEQRLNDMRVHDGSVCAIELSFDHEGRVFLFDLRTEWYDELTDILDEIQVLTAEAEDDTSMGGYFSKN